MRVEEFRKALVNKMFASRESIDEAYKFAEAIARGTDSPMHVMTAVQVVVNTIMNELEKCEDYNVSNAA